MIRSALHFLKSLHEKVMAVDGETNVIMDYIDRAVHARGPQILDVGCGYGRLLEQMAKRGLTATGVDVNPEIVATNASKGLRCITRDEFVQSKDTYDVMIMSHVIEHFSPAQLVTFMDSYLDRLKIDGRLIIATPLLSDYFYDDFDHIKPYQPTGLLLVFGGNRAQVQYYARNQLLLRDLWFRKSPFRVTFARSRYLRSPWRHIFTVTDFIGALAYIASGRLIATTNGWVGVFQKTK